MTEKYSNVVKIGGHHFFKFKLSPWNFRHFKEYRQLPKVEDLMIRCVGRTPPGASIDTTESEPRYRFLNAAKFSDSKAAAIESDLWRLTLRESFNIPVLDWSYGSLSDLRAALNEDMSLPYANFWPLDDLREWCADDRNWSRELLDFIQRNESTLEKYKVAFADYGEGRAAIYNGKKLCNEPLIKWGEKRRVAEDFRIFMQRDGLEWWRTLFVPEMFIQKGALGLADLDPEVNFQVRCFLGAIERIDIQRSAAAVAFKALEDRFESETIILDNSRPACEAFV